MEEVPQEPPKTLTVEEANALLPQIKPMVLQLQALQRSIVTTDTELGEANRKVSAGNGYPIEEIKKQISQLELHQLQLIESFHSVVKQLQDLGAWVKDLNMGLVDFYGVRGGEYIWLCWKIGEDRIRYWHALDEGFVGRQEL